MKGCPNCGHLTRSHGGATGDELSTDRRDELLATAFARVRLRVEPNDAGVLLVKTVERSAYL